MLPFQGNHLPCFLALLFPGLTLPCLGSPPYWQAWCSSVFLVAPAAWLAGTWGRQLGAPRPAVGGEACRVWGCGRVCGLVGGQTGSGAQPPAGRWFVLFLGGRRRRGFFWACVAPVPVHPLHSLPPGRGFLVFGKMGARRVGSESGVGGLGSRWCVVLSGACSLLAGGWLGVCLAVCWLCPRWCAWWLFRGVVRRLCSRACGRPCPRAEGPVGFRALLCFCKVLLPALGSPALRRSLASAHSSLGGASL